MIDPPFHDHSTILVLPFKTNAGFSVQNESLGETFIVGEFHEKYIVAFLLAPAHEFSKTALVETLAAFVIFPVNTSNHMIAPKKNDLVVILRGVRGDLNARIR